MRKPHKMPAHKMKRYRYHLTVMYIGGIDTRTDSAIELIVGLVPSTDAVNMQGDRERDLNFDLGNDVAKARELVQKLHGKLIGGKYCTASVQQV